MSTRDYWTTTIKSCSDPTHALFRYRREDGERVCDCCNFETAYQGKRGHLWQYPEDRREALQKALLALGRTEEEIE